MQRFTQLYLELDRSNRTSDKLEAIRSYFREAPPEDAIWAVYLLSGRKVGRTVTWRQMRDWVCEVSGFPEWIINECFSVVGDLSEPESLKSSIAGTDAVIHVAADCRLWIPDPAAMYKASNSAIAPATPGRIAPGVVISPIIPYIATSSSKNMTSGRQAA